MEKMNVDIKKCARCDGSHDNIEFNPLSTEIELSFDEIATHFALCPTNGSPILMFIGNDRPDGKYSGFAKVSE